jgi:hypothetical protein
MCKANDNAKGAGKFLDKDTWDALKAVGYSEQELQTDQPFGPVIFSYTRKQAIEDGVLIDVTELARQEGFVLHTAITCGLYAAVAQGLPESERGTLIAGLLRMLRCQIRAVPNSDRLDFKFGSIDAWALCGPGDDGEPVLTVMLEGED